MIICALKRVALRRGADQPAAACVSEQHPGGSGRWRAAGLLIHFSCTDTFICLQKQVTAYFHYRGQFFIRSNICSHIYILLFSTAGIHLVVWIYEIELKTFALYKLHSCDIQWSTHCQRQLMGLCKVELLSPFLIRYFWGWREDDFNFHNQEIHTLGSLITSVGCVEGNIGVTRW